MKKLKLFFACLLMAVLSIGQVWATVTGSIASSIAAGDQVILVNTAGNAELTGVSSSNVGTQSSYTGTPTGTCILTVEAGKYGTGNFSFKLSDGSYLAYTTPATTKNNNLWKITLPTSPSEDQNKQVSWSISFNASNEVTINSVYNTGRNLRYNSQSGQERFCCYTSAQTAVKFFKLSTSSNPTVAADPEEVEVDAEAHASQSLDLTYENWGTVTVDEVEATLWNDAACTETFDGGWISNVGVAAGNASVSFDIAANTGAARVAYLKIYALGDDASTEAQTVVSISQAKPIAQTGTFELFSGNLEEGDYVIYYNGYAMKNVIASSRFGYLGVEPSNNKIANPDEAIIWHIAANGDYWTLYNAAVEKYASTTTTNNQGALADDTSDDKALWSVTGSSTYEFINKGRASVNNKYLRNNGTNGFAVYSSSTGGALTLYKKSDGKKNAGLAYADADKKKLATLDVAFTAPTLSNDNHLTVSYTSSNTAVAEVANDGAITLKAVGVTEITASFAGNDEYRAGSASYTIGVTSHAGTELDPYDVADAKIVIDLVGTKENAYVSGIISQVDEYLSNYNSITYWISADGKTTGQQHKVYSGKGLNGENFSSIDDVAVKATVVVKGTLKLHSTSTYEFDYNNELVSYVAPVEPTVTLSPSSLNLEAEGNGTQEITLTAKNFENEVNEITCAFYNTAACDGEAISQPAWITNLTDNNSNQVSFDVADNDGDARQVWLKVTASDGTDEASAVLAISQAKYTVDYATLPFEFDGGRADIASTNGMSQEGLGTDYNSSPKLKFDGTGDWLIIKFNSDPGKLTYSIKNNTFSGGTFDVLESEDGDTYTPVVSHTEITNTQNEDHNLNKDTRFVKFIYTEKVNGNVGLGNIEIAKYVAPAVKPTITTQPVGAEYTQNETPVDLTIAAEAAKGGALSYQWYSNSSASTEGAVAIEGADETEYTPSTASIATTYYYCVVTEAGADEPTTSDIVAIEVKAAPVATGTFELFSGDLVEGDYVIYYDGYAMKNVVASDRLDYAEVTPAENKITNPDASIIWHIAQSGEYWTIYNAVANAYAAGTGAKNKAQMLADGTDDKALWTASGKYEFENKANAAAEVNKTLRNNGTNGFACYSTQTGGALSLYMKPDGKQNAGLAYADANHLVKVGAEYTTPTLTNPNELTVTYASSDADIVAVDASTGALTIKASGKAVITASFAGNDEYRAGSASYTVYVAAQAGTAADPLSEASAVALIDLGCEMNAHVAGIVASQDGSYFTVTLSDGFKFWNVKDLGNVDFETAYLNAGDEVTAYGQLTKYGSTYELAAGCYLTAYKEFKEPAVSLKQSGSVVTSLNVAATDVADQELDIVCTNFGGEITSASAKLYGESACETEITSEWLTDVAVNGAKLTFSVADNDGDARQVWLKVTASDGTDEAFAILTISQAKYIADYATLPFAFDGGRADIASTNGMSQEGLDSDYGSSPKLKFNSTGDVVVIKIIEVPGTLTYDIKGNSFSGSTFTVQQSEDGVTYSDLATYTELSSDKLSESKTLDQATRFVKFIYTEKVQNGGNVALGNIHISEYVAPDYGSYQRDQLTAGNYATICLPNGGTIEGATLFDLDYYDGANTLYLLEVNGKAMVAGRPYIILPSATTIEVTYTDNANEDAGSYRGLVGSYSETAITQNDGNYILWKNAYYLVDDPANVGANRAYIHMASVPTTPTQQGNGAPRRRIAMTVNGKQTPTGFDELNASEAPAKKVINGQLFILRGEKIYDATGRLVK